MVKTGTPRALARAAAWAGGELAAVIGAVGHEDDEGAGAGGVGLGAGALEAGEGEAEAVAEGGAVLDEADAQAGDLAG